MHVVACCSVNLLTIKYIFLTNTLSFIFLKIIINILLTIIIINNFFFSLDTNSTIEAVKIYGLPRNNTLCVLNR